MDYVQTNNTTETYSPVVLSVYHFPQYRETEWVKPVPVYLWNRSKKTQSLIQQLTTGTFDSSSS